VRKLFIALVAAAGITLAAAPAPAVAAEVGTVFYIDMENHNWTQPAGSGPPAQIFGNAAAPYINSLVTPGNPNAAQVSYTNTYFNVGVGVHPSLPNYLWQEAGTDFGVRNDNQPFLPPGHGANQGDAPSLSGLLQKSGQSWKSYQEDVDINTSTGAVLPKSQWTVPLTNSSGVFSSGTNPYNGSNQFNFATKHDGHLYFNATNGGNDSSPSNPEAKYYAPLQQLATDLNNNTVARYNQITPDQFNDMHTPLSAGFTYHGTNYTGDSASIAQGDNFLSIVVPEIMASQAYKNNGAIVLWWDETEDGDGHDRTLPEIVISPLAKGNAYVSPLSYTHSSDLKTLEELFNVKGPNGFLGDAGNPATNDLADFFVKGAIPTPEPASMTLLAAGGLGLLACRRWRRRAAAV
jgi:hypothetical protein